MKKTKKLAEKKSKLINFKNINQSRDGKWIIIRMKQNQAMIIRKNLVLYVLKNGGKS